MTKHAITDSRNTNATYLRTNDQMEYCTSCGMHAAGHVVKHLTHCKWARKQLDIESASNVFEVANRLKDIPVHDTDGKWSTVLQAEVQMMARHILSSEYGATPPKPKLVVRLTGNHGFALFLDGTADALMAQECATREQAIEGAKTLKKVLGLTRRYEVTTAIDGKEPMVSIIEAESAIDAIQILGGYTIDALVKDVRIKLLG